MVSLERDGEPTPVNGMASISVSVAPMMSLCAKVSPVVVRATPEAVPVPVYPAAAISVGVLPMIASCEKDSPVVVLTDPVIVALT